MSAYSFRKRFIVPISLGLGVPYALDHIVNPIAAPKRQTIRSLGKRSHARLGGLVQLYFGMRTKQCFLIGEARCTEVANVIIWVDEKTIAIERSKAMLSRPEMEVFAQADGFADAADMAKFWRIEHSGVEKFEGLLIRWEPKNG